jgi:hypothetical protein
MEIPEEEKGEVKPTWRLAWGLWWRMLLIGLGITVVIGVIFYFVVLPWLLPKLLLWLLPLLGLFGG